MYRKLNIAVLVSALVAAVAASVPSVAFAKEQSPPTAQEQAFYRQAFGHEFSTEEHAKYLELFGSVPTSEEVAQYIQSSEEEQKLLSGAGGLRAIVTDTSMRSAWSSSLFSYGRWISRDTWSLSLMPNQTIIPEVSIRYSMEGWQQVYNRFHGDRYWLAYRGHGADESMQKQYHCHVGYGSIKTPWNLEPSKRPGAINSITCN